MSKPSVEEKREWLIDRRTNLLMAHRCDKEIPAWVREEANLITTIRNDILDYEKVKAENERVKKGAEENVDDLIKLGNTIRTIEREKDKLKAERDELRLQVQYPNPEDMPGELAAKFCPFKDLLHFHHDGCPSEWALEERTKKAEADELRALLSGPPTPDALQMGQGGANVGDEEKGVSKGQHLSISVDLLTQAKDEDMLEKIMLLSDGLPDWKATFEVRDYFRALLAASRTVTRDFPKIVCLDLGIEVREEKKP